MLGWHNVILFNINSDANVFDDRVPGVWFHNSGDGSLSITVPRNGNINNSFKTAPIPFNMWSHIEISQQLEYKNILPESYANVRVYAADQSYQAQDGFIKHFVIINGKADNDYLQNTLLFPKEQLIEDKETLLFQNKLVAIVPILDKTYKIFFDVKPNLYSEGWHNVILFNINSDANVFDDRVPGVWFHNSGDGSLSITVPRNGNINNSFKTAPIPFNMWSHIEISQQLEYSAYVYTIKLNGEKVFSIENILPESYANVRVYAADQSYQAQDGFIKDFAIINGKADNDNLPNTLLFPKDSVVVLDEYILKKDNLIATLPSLEKTYLVSFKIKPNLFSPGYKNIIHLTTGGDASDYGFRIPSVYLYDTGKLSIWYASNWYSTSEYIVPQSLSLNEWTSIRISQDRYNSIYFFRIYINGTLMIDIKNSFPYSFKNVKVYCADPWYETQPASIKDLRIYSGNVEQLIEDKETLLIQNKLVAIVPILDITYNIFFDVKPNLYSEGWHNVIRFNINSYANAFDDRVPGVWFHNSGDGSLSITVPRNVNINKSFKTAPIPFNMWSHIEISQQLEYSVYVYTIKLNGEKVFSIENILPESYANVHVYAADQSYQAQDGFIKDFAIINGKADNVILPKALLLPKDSVTVVNEEKLINNNLIATLLFLEKAYLLSFKIKPTFYSLKYNNIIHLTTEGDAGEFGYRTPSVYIYDTGKLSVWSAINGNPNREFIAPDTLPLNQWFSIRVTQVRVNSVYFFRVYVDGKLKIDIQNTDPRSFKNVKVYSADPWYEAQPASIKDLRIFSGNNEQIIEDKETLLSRGNLAAVIPRLEKSYRIFFDVKPNSFSQGWRNVIHFTCGSDSSNYGDRVPGVWFHESGDGSLYIASHINGNLDGGFTTMPVPLNEWSHIEISQQLERYKFVYKIKLNGDLVFVEENTQPISFDNVQVYVSDPWCIVQNGSIKDLNIINGLIDDQTPSVVLILKDFVEVNHEVLLKKDNLIATLPFLEKAYLLSFKIKPTFYSPPYKSIIHLTTEGDAGEFGYRTPSVYIYDTGKLSVWSAINGNPNREFIAPDTLLLNEWSSIRITQVRVNSVYFFRVYVDGKLKIDIQNTDPRSFKNVKVYSADPWYEAQPASIKDLRIFSGNNEQIIEDKETLLSRGNLVAVIPRLEKSYRIFFDVKPNSLSQGWRNVIHFTCGSDASNYGDRVPGVWFQESGDGSLYIASHINGNLDGGFTTMPVPLNEWSHIEISQQLERYKFVYKIKLNGDLVFVEENTQPTTFDNVQVYVSDPWCIVQNGSIKDLNIINGLIDDQTPSAVLILKEQIIEDKETPLSQGNLVAVIPRLEKSYRIFFDVKPNSFSQGWRNVIHFTVGSDSSNYGDRVPAVWFHESGDGSLYIASHINGNLDSGFTTMPILLNEWSLFEISQQLEGDKFAYRIKLNGDLVFVEENTQPTTFDNVQVYVSDPWCKVQNGSIKNLKINNGLLDYRTPSVVLILKEQIIEDKETPLSQGNLVAVIPRLEKSYRIFFDVKPNSFLQGWRNVIHFTCGSDSSNYGDRVPAVWFHESGDGSLYIASHINGNLDSGFTTMPVPLNEWSLIEISQQLEGDKFAYRIKLNGDLVFVEENTQPTTFDNVQVYVSDPWCKVQNGSIKNLKINNGLKDDQAPSVMLILKDFVEVTSEEVLKKDNLIATLPFLEKTYLVSFKIKPTMYVSEYKNVIHLTIEGDAGEFGFRTPSVYFYYNTGKLSVWSAISGNPNSEFITLEALSLNEWSSIRISQVRINRVYLFRVYVDGKLNINIENTDPHSFENVKVYNADPWYNVQLGSIKDLRIFNGNVEQLIEDRETPLVQNKLVAIVPILDKAYKIYFDVKPNSYSEGWHNVIRFNIGSDANVFDDKVPGVWFHNSGDGSLSITVPQSGNLDSSFKTAPIPLNTWSHIEISQQLDYVAYVYTIKLNGEKVFVVENVLPESIKNVYVYASDQSYQTQDGFIKDFAIINGKADNISLTNVELVTKDFVFSTEEVLKMDNFLGLLPILKETYSISFKIKPTSYLVEWRSVIHLTVGGPESRIPAMYFYNDTGMHVWSGSSVYIKTPKLPLNTWSDIKISHEKVNGIYSFRMYINGTNTNNVLNIVSKSFQNVKVYASNPWYGQQFGSIKDLRIVNGN
ncbi:uncharacterized protein LOC101236628 [Hydra vulgaris]|uniref:uncharacterized protein LOC101236628 n=1 Tax=Hydra vulgaris TaxID=6087 RepID=UPI0032EA52B5